MIKRSELKEDMYVRIQVNYDDSFWSRLMSGRYMNVSRPDTTPDDSKSWGFSYGGVVFYGMSYHKGISNHQMEPVSVGEMDIIRQIHTKKEDYPEIHKVGKKIYRTIEALEELLRNDLELRETDLWDVSDSKDLRRQINEELSSSDVDIEDFSDIVDDVMNTFDELEELLIKLTQLEDKVVRGISPIAETSTWLLNKVKEDGSTEELVKISGSPEKVLEVFELINKDKNDLTGKLTFEMKAAD